LVLFQFLIGTVKTGRIVGCKNLAKIVSIPHRYCKNDKMVKNIQNILYVSIPHRYCKNGVDYNV